MRLCCRPPRGHLPPPRPHPHRLAAVYFPSRLPPSRALLCEPVQSQNMPASLAIEFCFHYAGFLGSFKLILILSSLLRPLKRAVFPPSLVSWVLFHSPGQLSAWRGLRTLSSPVLLPGQQLPDFQARREACPDQGSQPVPARV